ncbi:MAG: HAD-IIIA family hydrolase [Bacteroidaceae bacterium]|nr:HAD-IIIA family hydrolase [Bacteroidaceae bacterium]
MKTIIFDLDGTLLDTLEDLYLSVNHAMYSCGFPQRTLSEVRNFVGNGVRLLIHRAVPQGTPQPQKEACFQLFRAHYVQHCQDHTRPYPGIQEMLATLKKEGYRMGIVSNKLQAGVTELHEAWFRETIDVAVGESEGIRRKPAPDMVQHALRQLGSPATEAVYVGDSDVDLETARQAGMPCISVLWGFRERAFLSAHGATTFAERPDEIAKILSAFQQD